MVMPLLVILGFLLLSVRVPDGLGADGPALPKEITGKDGAPMVLVPAGDFWMGLPEGEGLDDEQPRHQVFLNAFYIDKYEVTTARYAKFLGATGWEKPVNWDVVKFPEHADFIVRPVS